VNSPEDGPVGPKHVEIRRYMNKIETVTSIINIMTSSFFTMCPIPAVSFCFINGLNSSSS